MLVAIAAVRSSKLDALTVVCSSAHAVVASGQLAKIKNGSVVTSKKDMTCIGIALATLRRARVVPATRFSQIVRLRNATIATCESVYGARLVGTFMTMMTIRMKLQAKMRMRMHGTDTWTPEDRSGLPLTGLMVIVGVAMVVGAGMSLVVDRGQDDDVGDEFDEAV